MHQNPHVAIFVNHDEFRRVENNKHDKNLVLCIFSSVLSLRIPKNDKKKWCLKSVSQPIDKTKLQRLNSLIYMQVIKYETYNLLQRCTPAVQYSFSYDLPD